MDLNTFGMTNTISTILNSRTDDSYRAIASFLVPRMRDLESVGVREIMEGAFVSRSAVRRFCNLLGYSSWNHLKSSFSANVFPSDLRHRDMTLSVSDYRAQLDARLDSVLDEIRSCVTDEDVRALASEISACDEVTLVCPSNTIGNLLRFQQEMLYAGKYVNLVADVYDSHRISEGERGSLIITVSVTGGFAATADVWVRRQPGEKALVTADGGHPVRSSYDCLCLLSRGDVKADDLGVWCKYGVAYYFDLLSACYLSECADAARRA